MDNSKGLKVFFATLLAATLWVHHAANVRPPLPSGALVREEPEQVTIENGKPWTVKGYIFTPLATYDIRARVLHTERYYYDFGADLSPVDWALGWRAMSDSAILKHLRISQGGRWYFYHYSEPPISDADIVAHSANTHILPATPEMAKLALHVRTNDIIRARGRLVSISGRHGYQWVSSLSRTDTGPGSCEVLWLESLDIEPR